VSVASPQVNDAANLCCGMGLPKKMHHTAYWEDKMTPGKRREVPPI